MQWTLFIGQRSHSVPVREIAMNTWTNTAWTPFLQHWHSYSLIFVPLPDRSWICSPSFTLWNLSFSASGNTEPLFPFNPLVLRWLLNNTPLIDGLLRPDPRVPRARRDCPRTLALVQQLLLQGLALADRPPPRHKQAAGWPGDKGKAVLLVKTVLFVKKGALA